MWKLRFKDLLLNRTVCNAYVGLMKERILGVTFIFPSITVGLGLGFMINDDVSIKSYFSRTGVEEMNDELIDGVSLDGSSSTAFKRRGTELR